MAAEQVEPQEEGLAWRRSNGYTVIDLSVGIAGAYCTKLLADGGAQVVKVEPPEGDPLRRWSASGAEIEAGDDGALFSFLACSKHSVVVDPESPDDLDLLLTLLAIGGRGGAGRGGPPSQRLDEFTPAALAETPSAPDRHVDHPVRPRGAVGRQTGDRVHHAGVVGRCDRPGPGCAGPRPLFVAGQIGEWLAGAYRRGGHDGSAVPASSTCRCWRRRSSASLTIRCRSSMRWAARFAIVAGSRFPVSRRRPTGWLALGCGTAQQWFDLCAMTGHDEWIDEESELSITEQANIHAEQIYEWVRENRRRGHSRPVQCIPNPERAGRERRQRHVIRPLRRARDVRRQPARRVHPAGTAIPHDSVAAARTGTRPTPWRAH